MGDDWLYDGDSWPDPDLVIDSTSRVREALNEWIVVGGLKGAAHDCAKADSDTVDGGLNWTSSVCGLPVPRPTDDD